MKNLREKDIILFYLLSPSAFSLSRPLLANEIRGRGSNSLLLYLRGFINDFHEISQPYLTVKTHQTGRLFDAGGQQGTGSLSNKLDIELFTRF